MSTSFPFLQIAREFGLPYGDVVRFASTFDGSEFNAGYFYGLAQAPSLQGRRGAFMHAVQFAILTERERRAANSAPPKVIETCSPSHVAPWAEGRPS